ncbi:unnamed protein product [Ophioblennius macclurei]
MEFHGVRRVVRPDGVGPEKQQMLDLNRRLEAYLNRVKLLEEENAVLAEEIQARRREAWDRRSLEEEELRRARMDAEAAWREGLAAQLEAGKLLQELEVLDLQVQREARAKTTAEEKLQRSRRELEEEQRAHVWLGQQAAQLEHEIRLLVQTHRDGAAQLEARLLTHARTATVPRRTGQMPSLLQLGQEFSHRAARAWQEAEGAHRGQLARLEEALCQTGAQLEEVEQEKRRSRMELRALEEEMASALDVRKHLEEAAGRRSDAHEQEIQQIHERLEELEAEREEIGRQMEHLLLENRGLLQMKTSLGLEVATYRALLDGEGFRGDVPTLNRPRNASVADAVFRPRGVKKNYHILLSAGHNATSFQAVRRTPEPTVTSVTPTCRTTPAVPEPPHPKILRGGAVESFRPQQVGEKVTSPADDSESAESGRGEAEELQNDVVVESLVARQVGSGLANEPPLNDEKLAHGQFTTSCLVPEELIGGVSGQSEKRVAFQEETEQEEYSDSETEAMLEPTCESRTSSPESECVSEEMVTEFNLDEAEIRPSAAGTKETDVDDKLYPDGEEMDTWDSVMERKVNVKTGEGMMKSDEGERERAEPEEDISEQKKAEQDVHDVPREDGVVPLQMRDVNEAQTLLEGDGALLSDKDEDDDSQNVSVSWRTELESDSYAQENTLADTRPLIRYKSDETDANAPAEEEESESSEGERDRKVKEEAGMGAWSEDKSRRFGTMEDLCEEIEGEATDEQYSLEYVHAEETDGGHGPTVTSETENTERAVGKESENQSEVETEKVTDPMKIDHNDEVEADRLVEQKLEDLTTDSYGSHVGEEMLRSVQETIEESQTEHVQKVQSENSSDEGLGLSSPITNLMSENLHSVQHKDHEEPADPAEQRELEVSLATPGDGTEIRSGFTDPEDSKFKDQTNSQDVTEVVRRTSEEPVQSHPQLSDELQQSERGNGEESKELQDVERYQDRSGSPKRPQQQLSGDVPRSVELSDVLQQPQYDDVLETSKKCEAQPGEDDEDRREISSNLQESQEQVAKGVDGQEAPDDVLKASEKFQEEPDEDVKDSHEFSSSLQQCQSHDRSEASGDSRERPGEAAADSLELPGFPQQLPADDFFEALRKSQDQLEEDIPDHWDISSSFESQADTVQDGSKEAPEQRLQEVADFQDDVLAEALKKPEEHLTEDVEERQDFPEAPQTAEWEVLEFQDRKRDHVTGSDDEGAATHREQDIFTLKEATESKFSSFYPSAVKSDFWVSSLEGGATFQADAAAAAAAAMWGSSEQQNAVNGNSKAETLESLESRAARKRQQEELVRCEDSEEEDGESWSSEE